jgi:hypothetical protein
MGWVFLGIGILFVIFFMYLAAVGNEGAGPIFLLAIVCLLGCPLPTHKVIDGETIIPVSINRTDKVVAVTFNYNGKFRTIQTDEAYLYNSTNLFILERVKINSFGGNILASRFELIIKENK